MTEPTLPAHPRFDALRAFDWRQYIIYIGFAIVFVVFAITLGSKGFLTPTNLLNVFRQTAIISIMAVAMTFVIGAGNIDLSAPGACRCRSLSPSDLGRGLSLGSRMGSSSPSSPSRPFS
jgi:ABC-type xylose transport system permease subunit